MGNGFESTWARIVACEGQTFEQVRGGRFTYRVEGHSLALDRTNQVLSRSAFERAFKRLPVTGPGELNDLRGPSYLFAILTDHRVSLAS